MKNKNRATSVSFQFCKIAKSCCKCGTYSYRIINQKSRLENWHILAFSKKLILICVVLMTLSTVVAQYYLIIWQRYPSVLISSSAVWSVNDRIARKDFPLARCHNKMLINITWKVRSLHGNINFSIDALSSLCSVSTAKHRFDISCTDLALGK